MPAFPSFFLRNKVIFKYLTSSFISLPVSLITGFITFRSIDPVFMGIWGTFTVFETYSNILRIGLVNGMNRELPFALGAGKTVEAKEYAETTLFYTLFTILFLILLTPFLISKFEFTNLYIACIFVILIKISLTNYTTYLSGTFRSDDQFNKLSNIQFVMSGIKLITAPVVLLGFYGFFAYILLTMSFNALLLHINRPFHIMPKFHKNAFISLIKIGFPIFIIGYGITTIDSLPMLYIIKFGNQKLVGLYTPILTLLTTAYMLPEALTSYMYPKFSYQLGKTNNLKNIYKTFIKINIMSISLILLFVIVGYFSLYYFGLIFPKYIQSVPYLKISLFICPFILYKIGNLLNVVLKRYDFMIAYVLFYAVIQVCSLWLFSRVTDDVLKSVLWSQISTAALLTIATLSMNFKLIQNYHKQI